MVKRHSTNVGPPPPQVRGNVGEDRLDLFVVRLIRQGDHIVTAFGVITNGARKYDHRSTVGTHRPIMNTTDVQHVMGQREPVMS